MRSKTLVATLFTALIVGSAVGPAALAASSDGNAVTGATVSFRTDGNAIVDYSVEDDTVVRGNADIEKKWTKIGDAGTDRGAPSPGDD